ncbi:MAG: LysR family transcriptional regulator [Pseudomonadota bacterium]
MNPLTAMQAFRRVVELGSFAAAAREADLSNAVVSKYVAQLEHQLGSRLLQRTTRQLSLTEAGQRYYQTVVHVLDELAAAELQIRDASSRPKGTLRLNAPMSFGLLHVAPLLPAFAERYPEIDIDLSLGDQVQDLVEEGFDMALRIRERLEDSSLVAKPLATVQRVLCAAPTYLAKAGEPKHPHDLRAHNCLRYSLATDSQRWQFDRDGEPIEVAVRGSLNANNSLALLASVRAGCGIALLPRFLAGPALQRQELVALLPDYQLAARTLYAVVPSRRGLTQKVQRLLAFFEQQYPPAAARDWCQ